MGVKFGMDEWTYSTPNFTPLVQGVGYMTPPTKHFIEIFTKFHNTNIPQRCIPCTIFTIFAAFVVHYRV